MGSYMVAAEAEKHDKAQLGNTPPMKRNGCRTVAVLDNGVRKIAPDVSSEGEYKHFYDQYHNGWFLRMNLHYVPEEIFLANIG